MVSDLTCTIKWMSQLRIWIWDAQQSLQVESCIWTAAYCKIWTTVAITTLEFRVSILIKVLAHLK